MEKADILDAIRRCAQENGGKALGKVRFEAATGITEAQWSGRYWVRWSDAVAEAGYESGRMNLALSDEVALGALADLVRDLGHYPVVAEMAMRGRTDPDFPNAKVFQKYGNKAQVAARLVVFCGDDSQWEEVVALARLVGAGAADEPVEEPSSDSLLPGEVYLMKSGAHYKIGRSNAAGRRTGERRQGARQGPLRGRHCGRRA